MSARRCSTCGGRWSRSLGRVWHERGCWRGTWDCPVCGGQWSWSTRRQRHEPGCPRAQAPVRAAPEPEPPQDREGASMRRCAAHDWTPAAECPGCEWELAHLADQEALR